MLIRPKAFGLIAVLLILALLPGAPATATPPGSLPTRHLPQNAETEPSSGFSAPSAASMLQAAYAHMPLSFEENQGQFDEAVRFVARYAGSTFLFTPKEMACLFTRQMGTLSPGPSPGMGSGERRLPLSQSWERGLGGEGPNDRPKERQGLALKVRFVGASPATELEGLDALPGVANYFIGNDPSRWQRGVPTYRRIVYHEIYPGTDLVYHGSEGRLKYDFHLQPGAEVERIELPTPARTNCGSTKPGSWRSKRPGA